MLILCTVILIVAIILFVCFVLFICYKQAFYNNKKDANLDCFPIKLNENISKDYVKQLIFDLYNESYEDVSITSYDGMPINARYYHRKNGAPLQIVFHGYKSVGYKDYCGGNKISKMLGHNILLVEQRGHGKSKSSKICFGIKEKYDCLEWVKYSIKRFGNNVQILLVGVSMGAATVLMASGLDLPNNVKGIVADCPYSSPRDIILKVCKDMKYPVFLVYPFLCLTTRLFLGVDFKSDGAKDMVKKSKTPILIIHGEEDDFVPASMSQEIFENCASQKELHIFKGATHATSFLVDEIKYTKVVSDFCRHVIDK